MNRSQLLEAVRAIVTTALEQAPHNTHELAKAAKVPVQYMQVFLHREKAAGRVSSIRPKNPNAPSIYYIGNTAPKPEPKPERKPKVKAAHGIPVQTVIVRPFSIAGEDGASFKVTMPKPPFSVPPANPWEVRV